MTIPLGTVSCCSPSFTSCTPSLASFSAPAGGALAMAGAIWHRWALSGNVALIGMVGTQHAARRRHAEPGACVSALAPGPAVPRGFPRSLRRGDAAGLGAEPRATLMLESRPGQEEDEDDGNGSTADGAQGKSTPRRRQRRGPQWWATGRGRAGGLSPRRGIPAKPRRSLPTPSQAGDRANKGHASYKN